MNNNIILLILGFPKSIYLNFKYLSFKDALKFPIIVSYKVYLRNTKGRIIIKAPIKFGMFKIGFGYVGTTDEMKTRTVIDIGGDIILNGKCSIGSGSKISINGGQLEMGDRFHITADSTIICYKKIVFGDNCIISWDNLFMDTDIHIIRNLAGNIINEEKPIIIGNNVWIGCRCTILKGTVIGNNVIVAANSCVHSIIEGTCQLVGGQPAKVLKKNITWSVS